MTASILIIYTGGTIGMIENPESGMLEAVNFERLYQYIPEVKRLDLKIDFQQFEEPLDSSFIQPAQWSTLSSIIKKNYQAYDGFVILHGTDTLAYTASALSFMLQNLSKPVVLTGAQLPIGRVRTDGKENLITSIEIAAAKNSKGESMVQEVVICFEDKLLRGNRSHKYSAEVFEAFTSPNYPVLANIGIHIQYFAERMLRHDAARPVKFHTELSEDVAILRFFPGMHRASTEALIRSGVRAIVLESYGSGNAPREAWLLHELKIFKESGGVLLSVSQCQHGFVDQGKYAASGALNEMQVISGGDMTTEAATTKLQYLIANVEEPDSIQKLLSENLAGELTTFSKWN